MPAWAQIAVWLLVFPVPLALWIWQQVWPATGKAIAVGAAFVMWLALVGLAFGGDDAPQRATAAPSSTNAASQTPSDTAPTTPSSTESDGAGTVVPALAVARVIDGDTIALENGKRVRLLQIDAPEAGGECFAAKSTNELRSALPAGTEVRLRADSRLDRTDRYGRLLRYVFAGSSNVNLMLVKRGAAAPYFYFGERGRYATTLMTAARSAKNAKRGLWGACRGTQLDPNHQVDAVRELPPPPPPPEPTQAANCHPSYKGVCLDPNASDYDCAGGSGNGPEYVQGPVRVVGSDPYGLDYDHDGWGCE